MEETQLSQTRSDLLPVRVPGTNDIIWVPPAYVERTEMAVRQMSQSQSGGGAGTLGTFADIGEAVSDFFGQEVIQREVNAAHRARADVLDSRKKFLASLSSVAQQDAFKEWQNAQDAQDRAQTAALERSVTLLRVQGLAAAGRGIGRIFNSGGGGGSMMPGMQGMQGSWWGPAVVGGVAGFGLAAIFGDDDDRRERYRNFKDPWI